MKPSIAEQIGEGFRWAVDRLRQAEGWQLALLALALVLLLPVVPVVLLLVIVAALVLFGRAWVREFAYLMRLRDDAFPGQHDKLIWAILLIVLPPVGAWLFGSYREVHWPEAKPGRSDAFDF
ncbi:hypothetical protein P12x_000174 [Tundrisphaera lichenicola]|uniref:hypothetical protein n=1 Tax=Tundrisphaera lichenicola TaxID=2029860 RepID=UPI003EBC794A